MTSSRFQQVAGLLIFLFVVSPVSAKPASAESSKDKVCRQAVGALSDGKIKDPKRQVLREADIASVHAPGMKTAAQEILRKQENYNRNRPQRNRVKWITMDPKKGYRLTSAGLRELCNLYAAAILLYPQSWCGGKHCPGGKKQGQGGGHGGGQQSPVPTPEAPKFTKDDAELIARSASALPQKLIAGPLLNGNRSDSGRIHVFQPSFENVSKETQNFFNLVGSKLTIKTNCKYGWFSHFSVEPSIYNDEKMKIATVDAQGKLRDNRGNLVYWVYRVNEQDQSVHCADPERGDEYFTLTLISSSGEVPMLSTKIQW